MGLGPLAARFGLDIDSGSTSTKLQRSGVVVEFSATFGADTPTERHRAWCAFLGTRLGIDRRLASYDFAQERATAEGARNVYEIPSLYGERFQQLYPVEVLEVAERVSGESFVRAPWFGAPGYEIALVRELPRHFHVLAERDLEQLPYDRDNMIRYARMALFYDAYNFRPRRVEKCSWGRLKWFETRDGQAASRATLLPDFDYDAARAGGAFALLERDRFVIAHPDSDERQRAGIDALAEIVGRELPDAPLPFSRRIWLMTDDEVRGGPTIGSDHDLEAPGLPDAIQSIAM